METENTSINDVMETMADSMAYAAYLFRESRLGSTVSAEKWEASADALENALNLYFEFCGISLND
jgi:hypothetical protein